MDESLSILSGQYNNIYTTPGQIAEIRGSGNFNTNGMSSNFQTGSQTLWKPNTDFSYGKKWTTSNQHPVQNKTNHQWDFEHVPTKETLRGDSYQDFALKSTNQTPSSLLNTFFSKENVKYLGRRIIEETKRITGETVKEQNEDSLLIIMKNVYEYAISGFLPQPEDAQLAHSRGNVNVSLLDRMTRLNQSVLQKCVKQVVSGISMYKQYYKDASSLPMPLSHPVNISNKGGNVLRENVGFYNSRDENRSIQSFNLRNNVIN